MEVIIKRKFDLFTCCAKYKIEINQDHFVLDKLGDNKIQLTGSPDIFKIYVNARNYFSSSLNLENLSEDECLVIKPCYNRSAFYMLFILALIGFIIGVIYDNGFFTWGPLLFLLLFQLYYIHYKRKKYFKVVVKK